ncbi:hypothetical protein [Roseovarius sp. Pro17]|uniref:hypothetical protein n=1 Tax=Roseovarius sp. Pro17 TaxID=3108175 RepID=UPI002D77D6C0|nr:hypothetical protein [Roseovarius sp. Pro17]
MSSQSKPQKRWMTSALKTAAGDMPQSPFQRGQRKGIAARSSLVQPCQRMLHTS